MFVKYKHRLQHILLAVVTIAASGCVSQNDYTLPTQASVQKSIYKRTIQFVTDDISLKSALAETTLQQEAFTLASANDFGEFRIILTPQAIKHMSHKPRLIGMLQRSKTPINVTVKYVLTTQGGQILSQGIITQSSEAQEAVYPRLESNNIVPYPTMLKVSEKLITEIQPHILATNWSATVISQPDNQHVIVGAGENVGIKQSAFFMTETQPVARLQVALFETSPNGQSRAVLRLIDGILPTVGRKLIPDTNPLPIRRSVRGVQTKR